MTDTHAFPAGFTWGAATSAYQVEGSPLADGAGPSIWHRFSHTPGRVRDGDTGDLACDHYRRFKEDVALMRDLGLKAYRFSVSWSRVFPEGRGRINPAGLSFYERLVDELLKHDIEPFLTLYHWDLPAALDDLGGWLNPSIADWFADYTETMVRALDGRVRKWTTLNEPWVVIDGGYLFGVLAPGHANLYEAPIAAHHLMRAHGAAVRRYRSVGKHEIGLVVNIEPKYPASQSPADLAAVRRANAYMNQWYLDPAFLKRYPPEMREVFGDAWREDWPAEDFDLIGEKIDFLGLNYYTRSVTQADPTVRPLGFRSVHQPQSQYTDTGWEVFPQGLTDTIHQIRTRYGDLPLYITENGCALPEPTSVDVDVFEDPRRVDYLQTHLAAVARAIQEGANVQGYFAWSLLDNFEWAHGYSKRFGLVHCDHQSQRRTWKRSAKLYQQVIATNGRNVLAAR